MVLLNSWAVAGGTVPATDSWTATSLTNVAAGQFRHTAVWTGTEMIVWGGVDSRNSSIFTDSGGRYDPVDDSWTATSPTNAPTARDTHSAIWTGTEMIVWAGVTDTARVNTGGRYCAQSPTPTPPPQTTPKVTLAVTPGIVNEGGDATFTISVSALNPSQVTTVHYSMRGKAQFQTDYTLSGTFGQADIPAGATSTTVILHALTDGLTEKKEKATMKLSAGADYKLSKPKKATVKIVTPP
jgi:hypothetical protein